MGSGTRRSSSVHRERTSSRSHGSSNKSVASHWIFSFSALDFVFMFMLVAALSTYFLRYQSNFLSFNENGHSMFAKSHHGHLKLVSDSDEMEDTEGLSSNMNTAVDQSTEQLTKNNGNVPEKGDSDEDNEHDESQGENENEITESDGSDGDDVNLGEGGDVDGESENGSENDSSDDLEAEIDRLMEKYHQAKAAKDVLAMDKKLAELKKEIEIAMEGSLENTAADEKETPEAKLARQKAEKEVFDMIQNWNTAVDNVLKDEMDRKTTKAVKEHQKWENEEVKTIITEIKSAFPGLAYHETLTGKFMDYPLFPNMVAQIKAHGRNSYKTIPSTSKDSESELSNVDAVAETSKTGNNDDLLTKVALFESKLPRNVKAIVVGTEEQLQQDYMAYNLALHSHGYSISRQNIPLTVADLESFTSGVDIFCVSSIFGDCVDNQAMDFVKTSELVRFNHVSDVSLAQVFDVEESEGDEDGLLSSFATLGGKGFTITVFVLVQNTDPLLAFVLNEGIVDVESSSATKSKKKKGSKVDSIQMTFGQLKDELAKERIQFESVHSKIQRSLVESLIESDQYPYLCQGCFQIIEVAFKVKKDASVAVVAAADIPDLSLQQKSSAKAKKEKLSLQSLTTASQIKLSSIESAVKLFADRFSPDKDQNSRLAKYIEKAKEQDGWEEDFIDSAVEYFHGIIIAQDSQMWQPLIPKDMQSDEESTNLADILASAVLA